MFVKAEINNFNAIAAMVWSGAVNVCNEIIMQKRKAGCGCKSRFLLQIRKRKQI